MNQSRRILRQAAAAVMLAMCLFLLYRIERGVSGRRAVAADDRARQHAADLRLCEVGINSSRSDFRLLVEDLSKIAEAPSDVEEAERRERTTRIINARYFSVDCERFVIDGQLVPKEATP